MRGQGVAVTREGSAKDLLVVDAVQDFIGDTGFGVGTCLEIGCSTAKGVDLYSVPGWVLGCGRVGYGEAQDCEWNDVQ
jgi:hypothetical protein